ncbi:MAG: hypothetical protein V4534_02710 [Myxococcota bacterium]
MTLLTLRYLMATDPSFLQKPKAPESNEDREEEDEPEPENEDEIKLLPIQLLAGLRA